MTATLLIAAHGTRSAAGLATIERLGAAVGAARPGLPVGIGYLDVASPTLADALDAIAGPVVVLPLLLSAGYHVLQDIPSIVAGRPDVRVARHLGPDRRVIDAVADRLAAARGPSATRTTLLARVGSSRSEAGTEFTAARALLSLRVGRPVGELPLIGDVGATVAGHPSPVEVASYLIAEGDFLDNLRASVADLAIVSDPIGVHPALVELVLARYDAA